jgi:glycosyltransferase involved in cell wall biosynthesis
MRILLVSWYFPPVNDIGAIRIARLSEFLRATGHDVHVLTGDRRSGDMSLGTSFPENRVTRAPWLDVNALTSFGRNASPGVPPPAETAHAGSAPKNPSALVKLRSRLSNLFINLAWIPDHQVGWIPYARRAGADILARTQFDLIYASGPPFSAFVVARALSRRFNVPWLAEYRDGWSRYVYAPKPGWREWIDEAIEERVTPTAKALVAVSEPWADYYRDRFGKPVIAVYNGFDPEQVPDLPGNLRISDQTLSIVHVGSMYGAMRDPTALYQAITQSGLTSRDIQILYFGPRPSEIFPLADRLGVSDYISLQKRVPHNQSLQIQHASDVLLLLQSPDDPRNVPAKFFEYLASGRPILGLGLDSGIPAQIIRTRRAGLYVTEPPVIAAQLQQWVAEKRRTGMIADVPASAREGLSRAAQFERLEQFLSSLDQPAAIRLPKRREDPTLRDWHRS